MPLYRFIVHAIDVIDDPEGVVLPDDDAAIAEAVKIVRDLKRDIAAEDYRSWTIAVVQDHRKVGWIPFATVE